MNGYRCPLGRLQPTKPDVEQIKRDGWREEKILVVSLDDGRLDGFQREFVRQIGDQLYGGMKK
ncbi:MAG: hypothetical protein M0T84_17030 [Betaproteobacteria bacterium]|nr:hypothetical protein [Betaproteobacteria bacterium]